MFTMCSMRLNRNESDFTGFSFYKELRLKVSMLTMCPMRLNRNASE